MDVLVAGGVHSLVFGNFQRNLSNFGIKIVSHTSVESKSYTGIPVGAEGVIILKDMINHELSGKVVADAKAYGLPYALVERKWSKAQSILTKTGFIKVPATNNGIKAVDTKPVVDFILEIRKLAGRTATLAEVRKRFPLITGEEYNVSCGLASKHFDIRVLGDKEIAPHIAMVLAEDYSLVKDEDALFIRTQATFPEIATFITPSRVRTVIQETLDMWRRDIKVRDQAVYAWALTRFRQFQKDGTGWITWEDRAKVVKPIFGSGGDWEMFCKARAEVFGPWSLKTVHLIEVLGMFNKLHPELPPIDLLKARPEIDAGRMKGFKTGGLYRTSVEAVEEYVKEHMATSAPAEVQIVEPHQPIKEAIETHPEVVPVVENVPVVAQPAPQDPVQAPIIDAVGMADLIESGIKIQMDNFLEKLSDYMAADASKNAAAIAAVKADVDALMTGVTTTINTLTGAIEALAKVVATTTAEVKALREQREAVKSDPASVKALNLGQTLMNAKGAEVTFFLGERKG